MPDLPIHALLIPVDGSSHSDRALTWAIDLARKYSASLTVLSVVPLSAADYGGMAYVPQSAWEAQATYFRQVAERAGARAREAGISSVTVKVLEGSVAGGILDYIADHAPDLVVIGSRGLGTGTRVLLGSVSDALVHHASCPVLVVKPTDASSAPSGPARA